MVEEEAKKAALQGEVNAMDGFHHIYDDVGVSAGSADSGQEVIGLLFPTPTSDIDEQYEERHMTLAAAKSLMVDLREAIEACMKHQDENGEG